MPDRNDTDTSFINTIRTLSMDGVQAANSGHPGTPMALSPVGASAPLKDLDKKFGFTVEQIVALAKEQPPPPRQVERQQRERPT
jgi:transketolase